MSFVEAKTWRFWTGIFRPMVLCAILVIAPIAAATAKPRAADKYAGTDAGQVILSVVLDDQSIADDLVLRARKLDAAGKPDVAYEPVAFGMRPRDFDSPPGAVVIKSLPPGTWEVFDYSAFMKTTVGEAKLSIAEAEIQRNEPFSARFEVKPDQAVYLGEFAARGLCTATSGSSPGECAPAGIIFQVSDESGRDLAVAAKKQPHLRAVVSILDVSSVKGYPFVHGRIRIVPTPPRTQP